MITAVLTMDDGPSAITRDILAYLKEKDITPVFFFTGAHLEQRFDDGVRAISQGAVVGNHTYSHPEMSKLSFEEAVEEIEKTEEILEKAYRAAGVENRPRLFRFPYGDLGGANRQRLQEYLKVNGFRKLDDTACTQRWYVENGFRAQADVAMTFSFDEWRSHRSEIRLPELLADTDKTEREDMCPLFQEGSHHIMLLHDHPETQALIPDYYRSLLDYVMDQGVSFLRPKLNSL